VRSEIRYAQSLLLGADDGAEHALAREPYLSPR
jgi:hypothetical protein